MSNALAVQLPVSLGAADSFAVLAGTTVTNAGASVVTGDIGVSPGTAVTGFPPGTLNGTIHAADAVAGQAQVDLTTAYNDAAGRTPTQAVSGDLGGRTFGGGVYNSAGALALTGVLTLDAQGDPNAVFIFQVGGALGPAAGSSVVLTGGAQSCNVFWQIGSSATLGANSTFVGNMLALTAITVGDGVTLNGRALARNAAVTLTNNMITAARCAASSNADLTGLSLSSGTLSPTFSASVTSYTAGVDNSVTDLTVTRATSPGASSVVAGGSNLSVGTNTVSVTVTAANGTTTKTYSVSVTRAASSNADLTGLSLSSGTLSPTFSASVTSYTAGVDNSVTDLTVTRATSPGASSVVAGGSNLSVGTNTVSVTVTAANGTTTKTYSVSVTRAASSSAPAPPEVSTPIFGTPISETTTSDAQTTTSDAQTTLTASVSGTSATVSVPAGALPSDTTVSIYPVTDAAALKSEIPRGKSYISSFAVSWQAPDGSSPAASAPVTMTITDPGIHVGDTIYAVTASGWKIAGITRTKGIGTITFTNGATFVVAATPRLVRTLIAGRVTPSSIRMRVGCNVGARCRGTATLSVPPKRNHGKKAIVSRVTVARARFSLAAGKTASVTFNLTASGRAILFPRRMPTRWVSMLLKTTVIGANRSKPHRVSVRVPGSP